VRRRRWRRFLRSWSRDSPAACGEDSRRAGISLKPVEDPLWSREKV